MRFNIRDLLLWTTIAAIYAAFAGALNSRGLLSFKGSLIGSYFLMAAIVFLMATIVFSALRRYFAVVRSGPTYLSFTRKQSYREYAVGLLVLPGALVVFLIIMNDPVPVGLVILFYFLMIMTDILGEHIVVGRLGMVYRSVFYLWEEHHFQIDPKTNRLHVKALSNAARKWRSWDITLAIPAEHVEEVRAILEAKQGATEEAKEN